MDASGAFDGSASSEDAAPDEDGGFDTGVPDVHPLDAAWADASQRETGPADGGQPDASTRDAEAPDVEFTDAALQDVDVPPAHDALVMFPDAEVSDVEVSDVELPDVELADVDMPDLEVPDADLPDAFVETPSGERPVIFTRGLPIQHVIGTVQVARAGSIWMVDPETEEPARPLLDEDTAAIMPSWSPDGEFVVFASNRGGNHGADATPELNLWVLSIEDGGLRQLTDLPGHEWTPVWSPDGQSIAFAATRDYPNRDNVWGFDVWVVDADGQNPRPIYQGRSQDEDPVFSGDSETLYFMVDAGEGGCFFQIWQASVGVGPPSAQVVRDAQGQKLCGEDPSVSPDGRFLYFVNRGQWRRMRLADGQVEDVTPTVEPWIGPTGERFVFMQNGAIWLGEIDGGAARPITAAPANQEAPDSFPRW